MSLRLSLLVPFLVCCGCTGAAEWQDVDGTAGAGQGPISVGRWLKQDNGLPEAPKVLSAAHVDGTVWAVVEAAGQRRVYALGPDADGWSDDTPPLREGEQPVQLAVLDRAVYLTAADPVAGHGSLYRRKFADTPWQALSGAPDAPLSAVTRHGGAILVSVQGDHAGLYASLDDGQSFVLRCAAAQAAYLAAPVRTFAASTAAARIFATGDPASGFGGLYSSDDEGQSWRQEPLDGDVVDVRASGAFVLLATAASDLRSDNYGSTFHPVDLGGRVNSFYLSGTKAFSGNDEGVRVSADGGATWFDASAGLPTTPQVERVYLAGDSLVAGAREGVFVAHLQ